MGIFASAPVEKSRVVASQEIINKDGSKTEIVIVEDAVAKTCIVNVYSGNTLIESTPYHNIPDNVDCNAVGLVHVLTKKKD